MSVNFFDAKCQSQSDKKHFGLCDDIHLPQQPAYIDEKDGRKWTAVVINEDLHNVTFTAVDNCIEILRPNGKKDSSCDGFLSYGETVIFVELKDRTDRDNSWVKEGERQIRNTLAYFEQTEEAHRYKVRKAYIANKARPRFPTNQIQRMEDFSKEMKCVLRIQQRIELE